jgi:hypothetical protein
MAFAPRVLVPALWLGARGEVVPDVLLNDDDRGFLLGFSHLSLPTVNRQLEEIHSALMISLEEVSFNRRVGIAPQALSNLFEGDSN